MNDKISLAIPFYNTSKYFLRCIKYSLESDFVSEIVVNDDYSTEEEWKNLNKIVESLNSNKIKLFRNKINLGGFENKYETIKKSTCEWVYLLDSDNYLDKNTLDVIGNISDLNEKICYSPGHIVMVGDDGFVHRDIVFDFSYEKIGLLESKQELENNKDNFGMFLNDGNCFINRKKYLDLVENLPNNKEKTYAADCIAFQYYWMISGNYSKVIKEFKYFHLLRDDSYWMSCGSNSSIMFEYYVNLFKGV